ncbi:MAG: YbaB/EbfC family nucleoid-associated protein [Spirochaetota bacterium]
MSSMNPMDMLKNFQNIQSKLGEAQEKLKEIRVTGTAGGDMVRVEMTGEFQVTSVEISSEAVDPNDIEMLQDLMLAAFTNATSNVKEKIREEMSSMTGGMDLPPGLFGS